jgi:hypothetical protein
MKAIMVAAGAGLSLALLMGCEKDAGTRRIVLQTDGTVQTAAIAWRDGRGAVHTDLRAELPWTLAYDAEEGMPVFLSVSSGNIEARMWIRVLEDGEEVLVVQGCQCDGSSVSAQASGVVGGWPR